MSIFKPKGNGNMTDMTTGSPYKLIFMFSLPLLVGNIFQQLYNMVDSIVVGQWIGPKALAAVGTGFPIIFMMASLFMGIGMGTTIMLSQFYGAKNYEKLQQTISTIYTAMMIGAIPLMLIGVIGAGPLLKLIQVPDDGTLEMAKLYMTVIFLGVIGTLGFNINAGILQRFGDSQTSLLFLLIASIINIVLDIVFTVVFHMGVAGVAFATVIGQVVSWIFGIFYINKHYEFIHISLIHYSFTKELFYKAMKLGIPSGIQQALFAIGIMVLQSLINSFGSSFMAGFNGANKIDTFAFMPIQSFATAMTTYTGQNVGAKNYERVKSGTKAGIILSLGFSLGISVIIFPFSSIFMQMFGKDPGMISAGVAYLNTVLPFYGLLTLNFIYNSVMRGAGEMIVPMISSFVALWFARLPVAYLFAHLWGPNYIFYSYAVGWTFGLIISIPYYYSGRWKSKRIEVH